MNLPDKIEMKDEIDEILVRVANISIAADGDEYRSYIAEAKQAILTLKKKWQTDARLAELERTYTRWVGRTDTEYAFYMETRLEELNQLNGDK